MRPGGRPSGLVAGLALLGALSLAACGGKQEAAPVPLDSVEGRFRAEFPGKPEQSELRLDVLGSPVFLVTFQSEVKEGAHSIAYADYSEAITTADPRGVLDGAAEGAARNLPGKLISKTPGAFQGFASIDYAVAGERKAKGVLLKARALLVGRRIYILQGVSKRSDPAPTLYERMLASFKLLEPPKGDREAPPATAPARPVSFESPEGDREAPPATAPARAVSFESPEGRFRVEIPGEPERTEQSLPIQGLDIPFVNFIVETPDAAYAVAFFDYPEQLGSADPAAVLHGAAEGAAASLPGKLSSENLGSLGGVPAIEFVAKGEGPAEGVQLKARAYLVGRRLYLLQALSRSNGDPPFYARMVASFQLLP